MSIVTYWDKLLVADNLIPDEIMKKLHEYSEEGKSLEKGIVANDEKGFSDYKFAHHDFSYLKDWVMKSGLIPELQGHEKEVTARYHFMSEGGCMSWHCDTSYSVAASVYLNECEGGELQVSSDCGTQSVMVSPITNRIVIIKCEQMHRVLPVLSGERHSIQIFVTYVKQ